MGGCVWRGGSLDTRSSKRVHGFSQDSSQARSIFPWRKQSPGEPGWTLPFWSPQAAHTWGVPRLLPHPLPRLPEPRPSPPGVPPPTWAVLRAGGSARAWQNWQGKGSNPPPHPHPALHPPAVAPPPSPPFGRAQPPPPPPQPVWSSRHSLSCHRNSDFPGVWSGPQQGGRWAVSAATVPKAAGFGTPSPPTASGGHGHCRTTAWQILARGAGGLLLVPSPRPLKSRIANLTPKGPPPPFKELSNILFHVVPMGSQDN